MRILSVPGLRIGDADKVKQLHDTLPALVRGHLLAVQLQNLLNLLADLHRRIQRGHWVLKDHGDIGSAQLFHTPVRILAQVFSVKQHLAVCDPCILWQDLHHCLHRHGLSAAGFSYDREGLPLSEAEGNIPDCMDDALLRPDIHDEILHFEYIFHLIHLLICGSRASLRPSPRILKHTMINMIMIAGKIITCG